MALIKNMGEKEKRMVPRLFDLKDCKAGVALVFPEKEKTVRRARSSRSTKKQKSDGRIPF